MDQKLQENHKGQFKSSFGFLMAAVGPAVGLGNLWGFPYKMGAERRVCVPDPLSNIGRICRIRDHGDRTLFGKKDRKGSRRSL